MAFTAPYDPIVFSETDVESLEMDIVGIVALTSIGCASTPIEEVITNTRVKHHDGKKLLFFLFFLDTLVHPTFLFCCDEKFCCRPLFLH
jgi:hypothetical protein